MKKVLNTDQQIQKISILEKLAKGREESGLLAQLGSVLIYSGLVEFWAVQAARLHEQIILKSQLYEKKHPTFAPHDDTWFYDNQVSTRRILKEIKKFLPLKNTKAGQEFGYKVQNFLETANKFLDYRNALIHRMASPKTELEAIGTYCDKAVQLYQKVVKSHRIMCEALAPYRFSDREIEFFYGKRAEPK